MDEPVDDDEVPDDVDPVLEVEEVVELAVEDDEAGVEEVVEDEDDAAGVVEDEVVDELGVEVDEAAVLPELLSAVEPVLEAFADEPPSVPVETELEVALVSEDEGVVLAVFPPQATVRAIEVSSRLLRRILFTYTPRTRGRAPVSGYSPGESGCGFACNYQAAGLVLVSAGCPS